jgi:hypothetical protein
VAVKRSDDKSMHGATNADAAGRLRAASKSDRSAKASSGAVEENTRAASDAAVRQVRLVDAGVGRDDAVPPASHPADVHRASVGEAIRLGGGVLGLVLASGERVTLAGGDAERVADVLADKPVSPERAAELLGVSRPTVLGWINEGLLVDLPVRKHHRVSMESIRALQKHRAAAAERAQAVLAAADRGDAAAAARVAAARERAAARMARRSPAKT